MPTTVHTSTPVVLATDDSNPDKTLRLRTGSDLPAGWCAVEVSDDNGDVLGTPIRFKLSDSGGRVAADFPSVPDSSFIVDSNGKITNG